VLYSSGEWLRKNREDAGRLARAVVKTLGWIQSHSEREIADRTPAALRGNDIALYVDALRSSRAMFATDGAMPADGPAAVRQVLEMSMPKVRDSIIDLSKTYTNEFVGSR
jgi:NitT/TauT family transport system substrate-binding protein